MYLCCDLGGTTCDWGIYDPEKGAFIYSDKLENIIYEDFYAMLEEFLQAFDDVSNEKFKITNTTLGIAGPTNYKSVKPTNIDGWEINTDSVNDILGDFGHIKYSSIVNDFEALGYGVLHLMDKGFAKEDYLELHGRLKVRPPRTREGHGSRSLVCGPGTGLGIACIVDGLQKDGYPFVFSSEGGHHSLAPESTKQYSLLSDEHNFSGAKSYEELLSRNGLNFMYNFIQKKFYNEKRDYEISALEIVASAAGGNHAADDAIGLFCEILANFCGNSVLTFNCDKAVFLWGGILREIPAELLISRFNSEYSQRRQHAGRVKRVPVVLLQNEHIPLLGCAHRSNFEMEHKANSG